MKREQLKIHIISYKTYTYVWVALLILLATTIAVAKLQLLAEYSVFANLLIASLKAILVLIFFMHLKYEGRFLRGLFLIAIGALTLIIILTFTDVWYR